VKRDGVKHFNIGAAFDHKTFDNVETVEFCSSLSNISQIPPPRWWRAPYTLAPIEGTTAFKNAADGSDCWWLFYASGEEFPVDRLRAELAEVAEPLEFATDSQHKVLQFT